MRPPSRSSPAAAFRTGVPVSRSRTNMRSWCPRTRHGGRRLEPGTPCSATNGRTSRCIPTWRGSRCRAGSTKAMPCGRGWVRRERGVAASYPAGARARAAARLSHPRVAARPGVGGGRLPAVGIRVGLPRGGEWRAWGPPSPRRDGARAGPSVAALARTYGITAGQLEEDWRAWVRRRFGWLLVLSHSVVLWVSLGMLLMLATLGRRR